MTREPMSDSERGCLFWLFVLLLVVTAIVIAQLDLWRLIVEFWNV